MDIERTIKLLKIEKECVLRQDTVDCQRMLDGSLTCINCDLVQEDKDILEAYDTAIECLKVLENWCDVIGKALVNCGFTTVDQLQAFLKEMEGDPG